MSWRRCLRGDARGAAPNARWSARRESSGASGPASLRRRHVIHCRCRARYVRRGGVQQRGRLAAAAAAARALQRCLLAGQSPDRSFVVASLRRAARAAPRAASAASAARRRACGVAGSGFAARFAVRVRRSAGAGTAQRAGGLPGGAAVAAGRPPGTLRRYDPLAASCRLRALSRPREKASHLVSPSPNALLLQGRCAGADARPYAPQRCSTATAAARRQRF